jgi:hypothetical protein
LPKPAITTVPALRIDAKALLDVVAGMAQPGRGHRHQDRILPGSFQLDLDGLVLAGSGEQRSSAHFHYKRLSGRAWD